MRTIQTIGFLATLVAIIIGYISLSLVEPDTSASAAGAVGLVLMFIVAPMFGCSALVLVPSSIALLWPATRERFDFKGTFWLGLWGINSLLAISYLAAGFYLGYLWLNAGN